MFCVVKWKKWCRKRYNNSKLYNKGLQRYCHDLDATNIISNLHQLNILINVLFTDRQKILSKFSDSRSLSNESWATANKLDLILPYKCKNFEQKLIEYQEAIGDIKENELTEFDNKLIDQIDPGWRPIMKHPVWSKVVSKNLDSGGTNRQIRNITSPEHRLNVSVKDVQIELQQRPPDQNHSVSSSSIKNEEDIISAEIDDGGIAFGNRASILSKKEGNSPASYLAKIHEHNK